MPKLFASIIVLATAIGLHGCVCNHNLFHRYVEDVPPKSPKAAEKWWAKKIDGLDLDFLALLCELSEIHRQNGATATYKHSWCGRWFWGFEVRDSEYPLPLPESALAQAKALLLGHTVARKAPSWYDSWDILRSWEGGIGCTAQQAMEICEEVEKKFGWR